ncbi:MAG: ABC transporter substrate-binding protein [Candidatus Thorarchaeota archaeon]
MVRIQLQLTRRWSVILLLFPLIAILLGGGFGFAFMMQPSHPLSNTLIWEKIGNPDSFDPATGNTQFGLWMMSNIYEPLYTYPFNSSAIEPLVPLLALEQPIISADGKNYTIELRQGITFHDGTPFNASCVKWNIERAMKIFSDSGVMWTLSEVLKGGAQVKDAALSNGTSSSIFMTTFDDWVANSGAIEVLDVYTVRFVLETPFSPFVTLLASGAAFVISPTFAIAYATNLADATWEGYGVDYGDDEIYTNQHTCGTGPYMLVNWVIDQHIELDFYENYWREISLGLTSEMIPPLYAGAIEKVFIRTNEDFWGRSLNLRAGIVDGVYWPIAEADELWDPVASLVLYEHINVSAGGYRFETTFFGFNMGNLTTTVNSSDIVTNSPFSNKNFRRTVCFAFDYQQLIDIEVNGFGVQGRGPIPMGMSGYNGSSFTFDYNITTAVTEWNLAMQNPEFVASLNSINSTLTFYYIAGSTLRSTSVDLMQQGLEDVFWHPEANHTGLNHNMTIIVEGISFSDYLEYLAEGKLLVQSLGWTPDYADPISYLQPLCYSKGEIAQQIGFNNTAIDLWYNQALAEIDTSQRQVYFNNIQDTIADEAPYLWAYQQLEFRAWRDWLKGDGLIFNPMHDIYFYHIVKTYIGGSWDSPYFIPVLGPPEIMFIILLSYVMVNVLLSPSLWRKRIKFALLASYTGIALFLTALLFIAFSLAPWGWSNLGSLWVGTVFSIVIVGILWIPWSFLYHDYKRELEITKPPRPRIDLQ